MDDQLPLSDGGPLPFNRDDGHEVFKQVAGYYDAPAYVRRARQVEDAFERLLARCCGQRDEWLKMVRIRLGILRMLAGSWTALRPLLEDDEQMNVLDRLEVEMTPRLRVRLKATTSKGKLRRALGELVASIAQFNRRWEAFLSSVDVAAVNALRDGYNRYFLLEKECAIRSPRVARLGFRPLEPLTTAELASRWPALPSPRVV